MKNLTILLAALLISISCYSKKKTYTYTDTTFNHIEFAEITFKINMRTKDTLKTEGLLKQMTIIDGIPCYGNISFYKNWELKNFTLADPHTFGEYTFPKDTYIGLKIDKYTLKTHYLVVAGVDSVNTCNFTSNQLINGLSCDSIEDVIFTSDWKLRACILGEEDTLVGNLLRKGTLIVFSMSGNIYLYCLYDPIIQGYQCSGTSYTGWMWMGGGGIGLYPSGQLKDFYSVDEVEIQGVFCRSYYIQLYESGKLKMCFSAKDQTIDGVLHKKKYTLEFDENGTIVKSFKDSFF